MRGLVLHWALPWHGWLKHMSSRWHRRPVRPGGQRQEKEPTRSMQVDPGAQVAAAQSSKLSSQPDPPQPLAHTQ